MIDKGDSDINKSTWPTCSWGKTAWSMRILVDAVGSYGCWMMGGELKQSSCSKRMNCQHSIHTDDDIVALTDWSS